MSRPFLASGALLACLSGCELVAGIGDKTLVDGSAPPDVMQPTQDAGDAPMAQPDAGPDPDLSCSQLQQLFTDIVFCDDFDTDQAGGSPLGTKWMWKTIMGGGTQVVDSTYAVSAPNSAQFTFPQTNSAAQIGIGPTPWAPLSNSFRLAFDVRPDGAFAGIAQSGVMQIVFGSLEYNYAIGPGDTQFVQVYSGPGDTNLATTVTFSIPPQVGVWERVVLAYDTTNGFTAYVNGALAGTDIPRGTPGVVQDLIAGNVYVSGSPSSTFQVELDNIVLRGD